MIFIRDNSCFQRGIKIQRYFHGKTYHIENVQQNDKRFKEITSFTHFIRLCKLKHAIVPTSVYLLSLVDLAGSLKTGSEKYCLRLSYDLHKCGNSVVIWLRNIQNLL